MIYEDVCTRKEYEVNGVKKVTWLKCGTLRILDNGKKFIELNHLPNTSFYVFPKKEKTEQSAQQEQSSGDTWLNEDQQ
jgi:hypothetical protein